MAAAPKSVARQHLERLRELVNAPPIEAHFWNGLPPSARLFLLRVVEYPAQHIDNASRSLWGELDEEGRNAAGRAYVRVTQWARKEIKRADVERAKRQNERAANGE